MELIAHVLIGSHLNNMAASTLKVLELQGQAIKLELFPLILRGGGYHSVVLAGMKLTMLEFLTTLLLCLMNSGIISVIGSVLQEKHLTNRSWTRFFHKLTSVRLCHSAQVEC